MLIRMLVLAAGPAGSLRPGQQYDLPHAQAQAMINAHAAELVETVREKPVAESAAMRTRVKTETRAAQPTPEPPAGRTPPTTPPPPASPQKPSTGSKRETAKTPKGNPAVVRGASHPDQE